MYFFPSLITIQWSELVSYDVKNLSFPKSSNRAVASAEKSRSVRMRSAPGQLVILVIGNHRGVGEHAHEFQLDSALVFRLGAFYPPISTLVTQKYADCVARYFCAIFSGPVLILVLFMLSLCVLRQIQVFFSSSNFSHFYTFFGIIFQGLKVFWCKNSCLLYVWSTLKNNDNSHSVYHSSFQLDLYSHGLIGNFCSCTLSSLLNNKAASYSIDRLIENNLKRGFGGGEVVLSLRPLQTQVQVLSTYIDLEALHNVGDFMS